MLLRVGWPSQRNCKFSTKSTFLQHLRISEILRHQPKLDDGKIEKLVSYLCSLETSSPELTYNQAEQFRNVEQEAENK